jgi:uncharacterized GH25 family protein
MKFILCAAMLTGSTLAASAHAVWLSERFGAVAVIYGVGPQDEAYDPGKIREVRALTVAGGPTLATLQPAGDHARIAVDPAAAVMVVVFDNGFWSKGADGLYVNRSKREVPGATASSHTLKYNVTYLKPGAAPDRPQGLPLEIVPLVDPAGLKAGADLPVRVLADGKPLAGAALHPDYVNDGNATSAKTDAQGRVTLRVRNNGWNVVGVELRVPTPDSPDASVRGMFATLSFRTVFKEE